MTLLADVFDPADLTTAIEAGMVRRQSHPTLPLTIYNYTEACQYASAWTPVTLACRGLIADADGRVVARPLPKFFNQDQPQALALDLTGPVAVTDKADGSLGIIYESGDGWAVATRGSFASDQALHATELLRGRYGAFTPPDGLTVLVEIVYPGNRIVLDYDGLDDLILLGAVEIATGRTHGPDAVKGWPGPIVESFAYASFAEALAAPPRPGREGLVVHFLDADVRVKIKYADYVRLHRVIFGLTARTVWDVIVNGGDVEQLIEPLPDEFHPWVHGVVADLNAFVDRRAAEIENQYTEVLAGLPADPSRKEFAIAASRHPDRAALFLRHDGRDYRARLWQDARPEGRVSPTKVPEE